MNKFSIEELYRCDRPTYCRITGVSPMDLINSLEAEVKMLTLSMNEYREEFIEQGSITDSKQRWRANIITEIQTKMDRKIQKIKDIKKEFCFK